MGWGINFRLKPEEEIIDSSGGTEEGFIRPVYSVVLTDKRAFFNFTPMSSSILGSFLRLSIWYDEISKVEVVRRISIKYLKVITPKRDYYLNVSNPDYWAKRIMDLKETLNLIQDPKSSE